MTYGRLAVFSDDITTLEVMKNLIDLAYQDYTGTDGSANGGLAMPQKTWIGGKAQKGGCMISDYCWMASEYQAGAQVNAAPIPFPGYSCSNSTSYCMVADLSRLTINGKPFDMVEAYPEDCSAVHSVVCEFGKC